MTESTSERPGLSAPRCTRWGTMPPCTWDVYIRNTQHLGESMVGGGVAIGHCPANRGPFSQLPCPPGPIHAGPLPTSSVGRWAGTVIRTVTRVSVAELELPSPFALAANILRPMDGTDTRSGRPGPEPPHPPHQPRVLSHRDADMWRPCSRYPPTPHTLNPATITTHPLTLPPPPRQVTVA